MFWLWENIVILEEEPGYLHYVTAGYNYLSLSKIPASGNKVFICECMAAEQKQNIPKTVSIVRAWFGYR